MSNALRIIDANANRAREALRVMEDAARFVLGDEVLCGRIKAARHGLAAALGEVGGADALAWRDTSGDVGTAVAGAGEYRREGIRDVVVAAGKRLSEALRSIEEYAKVIEGARHGRGSEPTALGSRRVEALRYLGYDIERDLVLAMGTGKSVRWRLCVIVTESLCVHHPWLEVARRAVLGGADCIQLREKGMDARELLARARALVEMVRGTSVRNCRVIINDRPDIALLSGADGVHLGQTDLGVRDARRIVGMEMLIGVSTERIEQARAALADGADCLGVGPMFPTMTKDKPRIAGPGYLREVIAHEPHLPACLAIGGITVERAAALRAEVPGFGERWGVAVSSAVCGAVEPEGVCRALVGDGSIT